MPKRRNITSSERKKPANDDGSVPEKPPKLRKQNRRLEDKEICENLINESDDNCSDFDDDVGDPDFILESDHNTESEQSDEDDVEVAYPHVEEVYHGEINHNHDNDEQEREVRAHGSQDITKQLEEETMVRFLLLLARELVLPEMKLRVYNDRIPRELRLSMERVIGPADMPEPPPPKTYQNPDSGVRKTCAICPSRLKRRTKYCCCKCKKPMCLTCCLQICIDCKRT